MKAFISLLLVVFLISCSDDSGDIIQNRFVFENNSNQALDSVLFENNLNSERVSIKNIQNGTRVEGLLKCDNHTQRAGKYKIVVYKNRIDVASKEFGFFSPTSKNVSFYIALDEDFVFEVEEF